MNYLLAILITIILSLSYALLDKMDAKVLAEENKRPMRVEILSNGQYHEYEVDGVNVVLIKENENE